MEQSILGSLLGWTSADFIDAVVCLDQGFNEYFKWEYGTTIPFHEYVVLSISMESQTEKTRAILTRMKPKKVVMFVSSYLLDCLHVLKSYLDASGCESAILVTTSTSEACRLQHNEDIDAKESIEYGFVRESLSPHRVSILYLPCNIVRVLSTPSTQNCDLFVLTSPSCRDMFPLRLRDMMSTRSADSDQFESIADISAADLTPAQSNRLKIISREITSALVSNLGLDPSGKIFALGKTSALVGFTVQSNIPGTLAQYKSTTHRNEYVNLMCRRSRSMDASLSPKRVSSDLQDATLLLIDRTQDLFTPIRHVNEAIETDIGALDNVSSLAHRILATIGQTNSSSSQSGSPAFDVTNSPWSLQKSLSMVSGLGNASLADGECELISEQLQRSRCSMSALSGLQIPCLPSICLSPETEHSDAAEQSGERIEHRADFALQQSLFCDQDERFKAQLCDRLRQAIISCDGVLPPAKKRGLGAEVLALLQALLTSFGDERKGATLWRKYERYQSLITVSAAVIDAMQRSNGKQLQASNCNWKVAYDVRSRREATIIGSLLKPPSSTSYGDDIKLALGKLGKLVSELDGAGKSIIATSSNAKARSGAAGGDEDSGTTIVDVMHVLLMSIGFTAILNKSELSEIGFGNFSGLIKQYLICSSPGAELIQLSEYGIVPKDLIPEILACRRLETALDDSDVDPIQLRVALEIDDVAALIAERLEDLVKSRIVSATDRSSNLRVGLTSSCDDSSSVVCGGIIARSVQALCQSSVAGQASSASNKTILPSFEHIETPMQQLARAGLGLISTGLGRLGFGSPAVETRPNPATSAIIVIFVIGGISCKEVAEVQRELDIFYSRSTIGLPQPKKIILGSTCLSSPEMVFEQVFGCRKSPY